MLKGYTELLVQNKEKSVDSLRQNDPGLVISALIFNLFGNTLRLSMERM